MSASTLGDLAGNRHERLGESTGRGIGRAQGSRSPARAGAPPRNTGINHIHRAGNGFSGTIASPLRWCVSVPSMGRGEMAVVLIVEDEEQVRVLAEAIIRELGHETLTAGTAEQALAVVEDAPTSTCSSPISACSRTAKPGCSSRGMWRGEGRRCPCSTPRARASPTACGRCSRSRSALCPSPIPLTT